MKLITIKRQIKNNINLRKTLQLLTLIASIFLCDTLNAATGRFRLAFTGDPSTEITLGFDANVANSNPVIYYSTSTINVNNLSSYSNKPYDSYENYLDMHNYLVKLDNLLPGQVYYFVVKDNNSTSEVYNFETISDSNNTKLSILAGGDSRNNWDVRAKANKIVSKLNAHAMLFDGDFTDNSSDQEWKRWFDDWQLTFSSSKRITPLVPARGNHEGKNEYLTKLFGISAGNYYANSFGGNLIRVYTLNSDMPVNSFSNQTIWLQNDLTTNNNSIWKFAQYHQPIRPHVDEKPEGAGQYAYWADLFYQFGIDAALEGDAHTVKTTWPLIPCGGGFDCDEGFKRDDKNGTVYLGEGSYAAPLRNADDIKSWTRDNGKFHQFKWIFVEKDNMEIRTVKYDANTNTNAINELNNNNRFTIPLGLEIWDPANGDVVKLYKPTSDIPNCSLTTPDDNGMYFNLNNITLSANASGTSAISQVQFYVDGSLVGTDNSAPYETNWQPFSNGTYIISAIAEDINGLSSSIDFSVIKVGPKNNIVNTAAIDIASDEYKEKHNGFVASNEWNVEICNSSKSIAMQGLRFKEINIPPNAVIESAYITFIASGASFDTANSTFWCEKNSNGLPFKVENKNLSNRTKTNNSIEWNNIAGWTTASVQTTPDLSNIVQELVQLPNWSIESPIVFMFGGTGKRRAEAFAAIDEVRDGDKSVVPKLTIQFSIPDCPTTACDDGDPNTINDTYDTFCRCFGEPAPCLTNITHQGTLNGGTYEVSNSIESTAVIDQGQAVTYNAGNYVLLDKGFIADSGEGVLCLVYIDGCVQLKEGHNEVMNHQQASIKNFPNPFTGQTTIEFELNSDTEVSLFVSDVSGKQIATLLNNEAGNKGINQVVFDGQDLAQGIYYCTLISESIVSTQKMMLMK